jgi:hypothetical protein
VLIAKHHRHKLTPTTETFGAMLGFQPPHLSFKMIPIYQAKKLAKEAGLLYHLPRLR